MKRLGWIALSSLGFAGLAAVPVACVSSNPNAPGDDSGVPPVSEDSAAPPTEDSASPGVDAGATDAGDAGAAPDAADAAPQPLTLRVLRGGAPEPGVAVAFQDATGAVTSTATTDATGSVSQLVAAGTQVTAALGTTGVPNLVTIQDVAPGDVITLLDTVSASPVNEDVAVTLPAPLWDAAGASEYVSAGSCGDPVGYDVYVNASCASNGQFPLFARATDDTSGQELGYTYQTGNLLVADGGLPADGGPVQVAISRAWSTSAVTETVSTSALPQLPDGGSTLGAPRLTYEEVAGGVPLAFNSALDTTNDAGLPSSDFTVHPGYPDFVQLGADVSIGGYNLSSDVLAATRISTPGASSVTAMDLSPLPPITQASIQTADGGTVQQPLTTWSSAGSLAAANGLLVMLQWYAQPPDGGFNVNGTWTLIAPPTATSVQAPAIPASLAPWAPFANATYSPPRVAAIQASFLPSYGAFRAQFATLPLFPSWQPVIPPLPVNGTVHVSVIYPNEG